MASNAIGDLPSVQLIGGKCAQLARLSRLQLPVPAWFCITTEAFTDFLSYGRVPLPSQALGTDDISTVRRRIMEGRLSEQLLDGIIHAVDELLKHSISGAMGVRSSATVEDAATAAFAGQFDTFLGVVDLETLVGRIKECWASLWSEKALMYLAHQHTVGWPAMAVIIQDFVPANIAGILFTTNPVNRRRDEVVIEASWGLGELVVGGKIVPDHFLVRIPEGTLQPQLVSSKLGSKRRSLLWNAERQCLDEVLTSPERQKASTLDKERIFELADLGLRVQSYFGGPQDIEWAIYGGHIYLLQARPITTL